MCKVLIEPPLFEEDTLRITIFDRSGNLKDIVIKIFDDELLPIYSSIQKYMLFGALKKTKRKGGKIYGRK